MAEALAPTIPTASSTPTGVRYAIRALRHRNYKLYFSGQSVSLIGTWITKVATDWLVFSMTGSPYMLGMVRFVGQIPTFIFGPIGGVLVDRWSRHRVLVGSQVVNMIASLGLAWFALRGNVAMSQVLVLSALAGAANAFDIPARQALVVEMIEDRADLSNAIALNSTIFNGARLVGPSIAGILLVAVGAGLCFLIDGISFLFVIVALMAMRLRPPPPPPPRRPVHKELAEGFAAAFGFPPIRAILFLTAFTSMVGAPYVVLLPFFTDSLGGGARTFGFLSATAGLGALGGAIYLAQRKTVLGLGRVIATCAAVSGLGLIAFAWSPHVILSGLLLAVTGFAMMVQVAGSNTMLQTILDDDKRGRVMSIFGMAFMGTMPIGSLIAGMAASRIGAPQTLEIGGIGCVLAGLLFTRSLPKLRPFIRPIYVARGILPQPVN